MTFENASGRKFMTFLGGAAMMMMMAHSLVCGKPLIHSVHREVTMHLEEVEW